MVSVGKHGVFLKWWVSPTNPLVFLLKMIILGWPLGVPPFKETPIYHSHGSFGIEGHLHRSFGSRGLDFKRIGQWSILDSQLYLPFVSWTRQFSWKNTLRGGGWGIFFFGSYAHVFFDLGWCVPSDDRQKLERWRAQLGGRLWSASVKGIKCFCFKGSW